MDLEYVKMFISSFRKQALVSKMDLLPKYV